jgi:hypothetical protein
MVAGSKGEVELRTPELNDSGATQTATLRGDQLHITYRGTGSVRQALFVYERIADQP